MTAAHHRWLVTYATLAQFQAPASVKSIETASRPSVSQKAAQRRIGIAAIPMRHAVLRIDAGRLIIGSDRAAIVLQAFVSDAEAIVPTGIFRLAFDDLAAIRNGEIVLAIVAEANATRAVQP